MITVVDVTAFSQCSPRNYKQIAIDDAIPLQPCTEYSRYEVLQQKIRKLYFDFDGVPDDNAKLFRDFVEDYNEYMVSKGYIEEPIEFICTFNTHSPNHPGLGAHIISPKNTMDAKKQHIILLGFLNEHANASKYKEYLDTSVYSTRQLFKLPHFIGLPMIDTENYHTMMDPDNRVGYIIQMIFDCKYINPNVKAKPSWKTAEKHISYIPRHTKYSVKELYDAILNRRPSMYHDIPMYIDRCQELLLSPNITESLTHRINAIINDLRENRNIETSIGLIEHISHKLSRS